MRLNSYKPDIAVQTRRQNLGWSSKPYINPLQQEVFQADTWVHLLELPSAFSFDEALLLCQVSDEQWVAWIPGHGEAVLHTDQFIALP